MSFVDDLWVRQAFFLPGRALKDANKRRQTFSTADISFMDTSLGGNWCINAPHQFTPFTDIRPLHTRAGSLSKFKGISKGVGRYYEEAINNNAVKVHMRFGLAEYNSMTTFFANMFDYHTASLARTGEGTSILFKAFFAVGFVLSVPLIPFTVMGRAYRFMANKPASKYYYLKPTMPLYWNAVNNICNMLAVNIGLSPSTAPNDYKFEKDKDTGMMIAKPNPAAGLSKGDIGALNKIMPDVFRGGKSGIDIYAIANRAQRLASAQYRYQADKKYAGVDGEDDLSKMQALGKHAAKTLKHLPPGSLSKSIHTVRTDYMKSSLGTPADVKNVKTGKQKPAGSYAEGKEESAGFFTHLKANLEDGADWVTFKVNNQDDASETFSNSTKESAIASKINSISSASRDARFSAMEGNIGDDPLSGIVEFVTGGLKEAMAATTAGFGLSGLAVAGGAAFTDIPEHYDTSTAQLPSTSYTMELRTPYGNKMSIFTDLYVPLAMLLAGALPLSTGRASFTSPFLCELYCKGRAQVRIGIIDSLSIKRGVGNVGWSNDHLPLGIDISFSVKDLSTIIHMPLTEGRGLLDEDTGFSDYMAVLGSLGVMDQVYGWNRLKRNAAQWAVGFEKYTSPAFYANWASGGVTGSIMNSLVKGTARL